MADAPTSFNFLCLLFRRDFDQLAPENKESFEIINQTFQSAVLNVAIKSQKTRSTVKIECANIEVPTSDKLLWTAMHYLIGADSSAVMEIHNFNKQGNTIDVEKYILTDIKMKIVRSYSTNGVQIITIKGTINSEILE